MAIDPGKDENDLTSDEVLDDRAYLQFLRDRSALLRARAEALREIAREILTRLRTRLDRRRSD
jgi:hypothetical protein